MRLEAWACGLTGLTAWVRDDMQIWVMQPVQVHAELVPHPSDVDSAHLVSVRVHHPAATPPVACPTPPVACPTLNVVVDAVRVEPTGHNCSVPTPHVAAAASLSSASAAAAAPAPLTPASSATTPLARLLSDPLLSSPSSLPSSLDSSPGAQQFLPRSLCGAAPAAVRLRTGHSVCYTLQPTCRRSLQPPERSIPTAAQPPAAAPARETPSPTALLASAAPKSRVEYSIVVECSVSEHSGATDGRGDDHAPSVAVVAPGYVSLTYLHRLAIPYDLQTGIWKSYLRTMFETDGS